MFGTCGNFNILGKCSSISLCKTVLKLRLFGKVINFTFVVKKHIFLANSNFAKFSKIAICLKITQFELGLLIGFRLLASCHISLLDVHPIGFLTTFPYQNYTSFPSGSNSHFFTALYTTSGFFPTVPLILYTPSGFLPTFLSINIPSHKVSTFPYHTPPPHRAPCRHLFLT